MTNKKLFLTTLVAGSISAALAQPIDANSHPQLVSSKVGNVEQLEQRYIIKFKNASSFATVNKAGKSVLSAKAANNAVNKAGGNVKLNLNKHMAVAATLTPAAKRMLEKDPNIDYIEIDQPRRLMAQTQPYGIGMVQADQVDDSVASAAAGGKKICVIDSGLDLPHEDMGSLGGTINGTNDSGTGNWYEHGGPHGTHVAGTIAALNNGLGVRGVIGTDPNLHIIKVFNESGWGYSSSLVSAIQTCADNGSDVVNMSLGGSGSSTTEGNAMQTIYDSGVLLIAAAGNDGVATNTTDAESFPASYDAVVSVAAIDNTKALADFSQKNSQVEISGPGVDVYSTYPEGLGSVVELSVGSVGYSVNALENQGAATGALYDMGTGETINTGASGKVCLIQRGAISFHDKVKNCQDSGGVGAVIYNNTSGSFGGTLGSTNATTIPAVTASDTDGAAMLNQLGQTTSVNIGAGNYGKMSGTSMASPHVAGVAALVWSTHPTCTAAEIRNVLNTTAQDLGSAGRDVKFGFGLVQTKAAVDYITNNGCDGSGGSTPPPSGNTLENGTAKTGLSAATGEELHYTLEVPSGATDLSFVITGGSGDADLYVKFGSQPTTSSYDCRPYKTGNEETCSITNVQTGTYYVMVRAYSSFSSVSLTGSFTEGAAGGSASLSNLSGAQGAWDHYTVDIPAGMSTLTVAISGGSGDADLYVKYGSQPTTSSYDCRPYKSGNTETCSFTNPAAGIWHISLRGYSNYSGVNLNVDWNP
jgi:serine protease